MNIKAMIPPGQTGAVVNGLHQWDYGRMLEIHCSDLPAIVEVHFACIGMEEAIVRTGEAVSGKVTVTIPDICLERTAPVTAWVYCMNDTSGRTAITITLPIIPRARPLRSDYEPEVVQDSYAELVAAVNGAVDSIKSGAVMVANAAHATTADRATMADSATTASKATNDKDGNSIVTTYRKNGGLGFQPSMYFQPQAGCLYLFMVTISGNSYSAPILWATGAEITASLGYGFIDGVAFHFILKKSVGGELTVEALRANDGFSIGELTGVSFYFCQI